MTFLLLFLTLNDDLLTSMITETVGTDPRSGFYLSRYAPIFHFHITGKNIRSQFMLLSHCLLNGTDCYLRNTNAEDLQVHDDDTVWINIADKHRDISYNRLSPQSCSSPLLEISPPPLFRSPWRCHQRGGSACTCLRAEHSACSKHTNPHTHDHDHMTARIRNALLKGIVILMSRLQQRGCGLSACQS